MLLQIQVCPKIYVFSNKDRQMLNGKVKSKYQPTSTSFRRPVQQTPIRQTLPVNLLNGWLAVESVTKSAAETPTPRYCSSCRHHFSDHVIYLTTRRRRLS